MRNLVQPASEQAPSSEFDPNATSAYHRNISSYVEIVPCAHVLSPNAASWQAPNNGWY
jgi:hypothetical protein